MKVEDKISEAYEKSLSWLTIRNAGIKAIPKQLENLERLERLQLDNNPIESFDIDFSKLKNLEYLDLYNCNIKTMPPGLAELPKLKTLNLGSNLIQDCKLDYLPKSLKEINLHKNNLKNIPDDLLRHLNINVIGVSDNKIENIDNLLSCSKRVFILNVNNNKIANLPEKSSQLKINRFHCSSNLIKEVPDDIWMIKGLETIDLSNNQIKEIPPCHSQVRLYNLDISKNQIMRLDGSLFSNSKLHEINISDNYLLELPSTLTGLENLIELDISNNKIRQFPENIINQDIRKFYWGGNQFQGVFGEFGSLESYFEAMLEKLKLRPIDDLIVDADKLNETRFDEDFPKVHKQGGVLTVTSLSSSEDFDIGQIAAIGTVYQKPAKGGGSLSLKIEFTQGKDKYIYNKYGNNPRRKYELSKFGYAISKLIDVKFKLIDGGYDC